MATFPGDTLDLSALFRSCVDCFAAIQYDDSLEADTHGHLLRLYCIGLKFTEWGYSRGLCGDENNLRSDLREFRQLLEIFLKSIKDQFRWARFESEGFDQGSEAEGTWTLDQRKVLRNLVERVKSEVDALLWLFPEHVALQQNKAIVREVEDIQDQIPLNLQDINQGKFREDSTQTAIGVKTANDGTSATFPRRVEQPLFKDFAFTLAGNHPLFRKTCVFLFGVCFVVTFALGSCFVPFLSDSCV